MRFEKGNKWAFKKGHPKSEKSYVFPKDHKINNGRKIDEFTREKMSNAHKDRKKELGYINSPEAREKISVSKMGNKNPMFGIKHTEEWKDNMRRKYIGEKSHLWKGGITKLGQAIRTCFKYKNWRKSIFERDGYICQICDKHGGVLNADHFPKMFNTLLQENDIKTLGDELNCDLLWTADGRTLCDSCHRETETYGNRYKISNIYLLLYQ